MNATDLSISIIVPAYNEEGYLGPTLEAISAAIECLQETRSSEVEVIVVNNGSTDRTAEIAAAHGADVVEAPRINVAAARNAGARVAQGEVLVFVDADTIWPKMLLSRIADEMSDAGCLGGAVDTDYRPRQMLIHCYLQFWRILGAFFRIAQGATQFCRAGVFHSLGGYDKAYFMGEDGEFYWRLRRASRKAQGTVAWISELRVRPSTRRFDQWPIWKTLFFTNPLVCAAFARSPRLWGGWYQQPTR